MATSPANWGNINMLRDQDNDAGFYVAVSSPSPNWRGAVLYVSADGGASYEPLETMTANATFGTAQTIMPNFLSGNIPDEASVLNVSLIRGELSSVTYEAFIKGLQAGLIGNEIVYFRNAVLQIDGTYNLTGFLRGRRGTDHAISSHVGAERFVLLTPSSVYRIGAGTSTIGIELLYKCPSIGGKLADALEYPHTNRGMGLKPYAPILLGGAIDPAGDALLQWTRRTRISAEWRDNVDVPVSETSEAYTVEIYDAGFTTLKRTISSSVPSVSYSSAQQTADFGAPQTNIYFRVYQMSELLGRGYGSQGTIPTSLTTFLQS
jgi:hypothetical protein